MKSLISVVAAVGASLCSRTAAFQSSRPFHLVHGGPGSFGLWTNGEHRHDAVPVPAFRLSAKAGEGKQGEDENPDEKSGKASKEDLVRAVGEQMRKAKQGQGRGAVGKRPDGGDGASGEGDGGGGDGDPSSASSESLLNRLNPFKAGQNLRKTIDTALTSINLPSERKSLYYLDDRLNELTGGGAPTLTERNPLMDRLDQDDFVPEVLVVGATGEVGRLVVRRLLLEGRFRVRVLVRDLYTRTLNLLGTGITYCQGDLANMDSLEYALTDVDKIVFCASPPRPDEEQFQEKFEDYMKETLESRDAEVKTLQARLDREAAAAKIASDSEWEQLEAVLEVRARLAEQVDCVGMQNLVRAYQNVRHADYGTSQAAKRSLFKFQSRPEDFNLFAVDDASDEDKATSSVDPPKGAEYDFGFDESEYEDAYGDDVEERRDATVKTQTQWMKNQFEHGVFVGKVPKATGTGVGGESAIVSSRLRSRENPEKGIDLSAGFAGFICRLCSDGGTYEVFIRTGEYYENGIEYVCEFSTATKPIGRNKSPNKFTTVRLPFENFKPVRRSSSREGSLDSVPPFRGQDMRNMGFRYRSSRNALKAKLEPGEWSSFYLALSYVKLYRSQPEPEFVYVSDARVPPVVRSGMVRHAARRVLPAGSLDADGIQLLDESTLQLTKDRAGRSPEETYYKFRGEEIIKSSGISYTIVRVAGYNEDPSGEASTIVLRGGDDDIAPVSRADVAQVCVAALLDPNALNKSLYMSKKSAGSLMDEDISAKFAALPKDSTV